MLGSVEHEKSIITSGPGVHNRHIPGPEVIKLFSCPSQLSMKFFLLINVKCQQLLAFQHLCAGKIAL